MAGVRVASDKALTALVVAVLVMCVVGFGLASASAANLVPAVYVFGDASVDVGNNGPLELPYGIDLPSDLRPTGRVSNGYNVADYISRHLGFKKSPPAYLSVTPHTRPQILRGFGGVSYASGGSGILNTTRIMPNSISMAEQVEFFRATKSQMTQHAAGGNGSVAAIDDRLSKSLFLISTGINDVFRQVLNPDITLRTFYAHILSNYTRHVHTLYDLGARRFGIIDIPPAGCVPMLRAEMESGGCMSYANFIANRCNSLMREMMANFSADTQRPGMAYSLGSSFELVSNFTADPVTAGFSDVAGACCGGARFGDCVPAATVCVNRPGHLYWDFAHGSQATAKKSAEIMFHAPVELGFASPVNFKKLVSSTPRGFGGLSSSSLQEKWKLPCANNLPCATAR